MKEVCQINQESTQAAQLVGDSDNQQVQEDVDGVIITACGGQVARHVCSGRRWSCWLTVVFAATFEEDQRGGQRATESTS